MTGRLRLSMAAVGVLVVVLVAYLLLRTDSGAPPASGPVGTTPPPSAPVSAPSSASIPPAVVEGTLTITVAVAPPNIRTLHVRGAGFGAGETVRLTLNGRAESDARADPGGVFTAIIHLPARGSDFTVRAVGATSGRSATGTASF